VYAPIYNLQFYGLKPGQRVGVAGLGGLGHAAVKIALAWGCPVTVLSRGNAKRDLALSMGAGYLDVKDEAAVKDNAEGLDFIVDTIAADHDIEMYLSLLDVDGRLVLVGAPPHKLQILPFNIIGRRKSVSGSLIGGIQETQDMLDFCGKHNIVLDIEMFKGSEINEAYKKVEDASVRFRAVIDTSTF
jgi:uncharacterized zinc-type alcohol dehydrogenase-like protein